MPEQPPGGPPEGPDPLPDGVECPICEEEFESAEQLEEHIKAEHG